MRSLSAVISHAALDERRAERARSQSGEDLPFAIELRDGRCLHVCRERALAVNDAAWRSLCVIALVLLTNCRQFGPVQDDALDRAVTPAPDDGRGMIVGSLTAPRALLYSDISHSRCCQLDGPVAGLLRSASSTSGFLWLKAEPIHPGERGA